MDKPKNQTFGALEISTGLLKQCQARCVRYSKEIAKLKSAVGWQKLAIESRDGEISRLKERRVECPVCKEPVHARDYGGEDKEGSYHKDCIVKKYDIPLHLKEE